MTKFQNKKYKALKEAYGEKEANIYWREIKTKEANKKLENDYPMDKPVMDKGQIKEQTSGAFISKKMKKTGIYS